jgi:tetratricopeptide (TPR) repeat protein
MQISHGIVKLILLTICPGVHADEAIQFLSMQTHSRFTLHIDESVPASVKNLGPGFEIYLKGVGLSDLGAPLGDEARWRAQYETLSDPRLQSLDFKEIAGGIKILGKWKFPVGKYAPANPTMEIFDYHEKSPPRYVLDFWVKSGPTRSEVDTEQRRSRVLAILKHAKDDEKKRVIRKLASEQRHEEADNFTRFCGKPLSSGTDLFLQFYPLHQKFDFGKWLPETSADAKYAYYTPKKKSVEADYVRLALTLAKQNKTALAIRTLDFFDREYPHSSSQAEMKFLRANSLMKLGMQAESEQLLKELMTEAKGTQVANEAAKFLTYKLVKQDLALPALQNFLWLIETYPESTENWVYHLGAAECLYALKETDRAAKEYRWVMEHGPGDKEKSEASFRIGDLYLARFQYEQALASYFQGSHYFEAQSGRFPAFHLNRGEALYQIGEYDRAKKSFEEFLENFPNYPQGWRATYRLGEIAGRNGAADSRRWFYQTINRYPFSPGALLSRLYLIPCGDHAGLNLEAAKRFFEEDAKKFDGGGEVVMKDYDDLTSLTYVRTLLEMGNREEVANQAIQALSTAKGKLLKKSLTLIANNFFGKMILELLKKGKKFEALTTYNARAALIPKADVQFDASYLLALSQAAADLGLGNLAKEISEAYRKTIEPANAGRSLASVDSVADQDDLGSLIKVSDAHYTAARALWLAHRNSLSESDTDEIRENLAHVREESKYSYPKEIILGLIDQAEKKYSSAAQHVSRAQLLNSNPRIEAWLASLQVKMGNSDGALVVYRKLERELEHPQPSKDQSSSDEVPIEKMDMEQSLGLSDVPDLASLILIQGELLEKAGKWGEAAGTYSRAVENGWGGNQILYEYARTLIKSGGEAQKLKGHQTLEKIVSTESKSENEKFWKKLAQETLADEKSKQSVLKMPRRAKNE